MLSGCSKIAVFEPTSVKKRLDYNKHLHSEVVQPQSSGATLTNSTIITTADDNQLRAGDDYIFLSNHNGWSVLLKDQKLIKILSPSGAATNITQDETILSATTDGKILALSTAQNSHRVIEIDSKETLFFTQEKLALTANTKTAEPFLDDKQIIFATLDGKLIFVDRAKWTKSKESVIGYEQFFNNPIYLGFHEGSIISATTNRIVAIDTLGKSHTLDKEIKRAIKLDSGLYIFALDGEIARISGRLERLASTKIPFAKIVAAVETKGYIYLVEHSGWIIKLSSDLKEYWIYELPDIASMPLLASKKQLYYGRKIIFWP